MKTVKWVEIKGDCPICGHRGWCTISTEGNVINCKRAVNNHPIPQKDGTTGYIHPFDGHAVGNKIVAGKPKNKIFRTEKEWKHIWKKHRADCSPARLEAFAKEMGLSVRGLTNYGIGYDYWTGNWSFPMYGSNREIVGIRLRSADGSFKGAVRGSTNGLFVPQDYDDKEPDDPFAPLGAPTNLKLLLLTPEGPTNAVAAYDMGYRAIGRPNSSAGAFSLKQLLAKGHPQDVIMVADNDATKYTRDGTPFWPGIEGSLHVSQHILTECGKLRFMMTPEGCKDLRDYLPKYDPAVMLAYIAAAPVVDRDWLHRAGLKIEKRKQKERKIPA